ncbi:hypothetical protein KZ287_29135, partial [Escherichia coli]|nr:hypothetical protein [Escherichia coli]
ELMDTKGAKVGKATLTEEKNGVRIKDLNHQDLPDPDAERFKQLEHQLSELQQEIKQLKEGKIYHDN